MYKKKWKNLREIDDAFELEPEIVRRTQCSGRVNFVHLAFDCHAEYLVAIDATGYLYYIDLNNTPSYQKLGNIGQATLAAFNPVNKFEILVGLTTADIKILRVNANVAQFCLLIAHKLPPTHISFFKQYCLTCSRKEVIIWCLRSCSKVQQLRVNTKNVIIRKASFTSLGHIVVLYDNDTLQAWNFNELENDVKIDAKTFGIRNIKNFIFTQNGRAMIIAGAQNKMIILSTGEWNLLKTLLLPDNIIGVKQMAFIPSPLDGGANNVLACISSSCTLHFFDLTRSCIVHALQFKKPIKKIAVSADGRFIAIIDIEGHVQLTMTEKLYSEKRKPTEKLRESCRPVAHGVPDHLQCIRQLMKQELRLERLIPILKEFGEYSEKYRLLIWSTILKLPGNKSAYCTLANEAANLHFSAESLKCYPLASRSKQILLTTTMNCLIQWSSLLSQCSFLPKLVFPFLMVSQKDPLRGFELIVSILLNYCQKWFEYHPLPPLNVLGIIENILLQADPALLNIFCERGVTSSEYAWPLLMTAMSEILSGPEWLILWDHLISYKKPSLLLMSVVAYSICSRDVIISSLHTPEQFKRYYTSQGHISAKEIIKLAQRLDKDIPLRAHPSRYLRNELITLSPNGPYLPFMLHDFPKFLTDEMSVLELEKMKEKERIAQEHNRKAAEIAEQKRLKQETNAFMEQINRARLTEVERCIKEQFSDEDWRLGSIPHVHKSEMQYNIPELEIAAVSSDECVLDSSSNKSKHHERLQQDVENLEYEVYSLLNSLRSQKSKLEDT
ncbi:TBC1 domain family member 31 [Lasioglossum baleicum]|uniref:TBC1 domain family member 31 n=1 Tax=Lasioglossum baleicum TaxID=434251 RepID=UPI003FCEC343